jgi:hypothetical protein
MIEVKSPAWKICSAKKKKFEDVATKLAKPTVESNEVDFFI